MRKMQKWLIVVIAPIEIIGCAVVGAFIGGRDACRNIRDAWIERR